MIGKHGATSGHTYDDVAFVILLVIHIFGIPRRKEKHHLTHWANCLFCFVHLQKGKPCGFCCNLLGKQKEQHVFDLNFTLFFFKKSPDLFVTKMRFRIWMFCTATARSVRELKGLQALLKAIHLMPITPQRYTFGSVQVDITLHTKRLRPIYFFLGGTWGCFMGFSSQLTMIPINDH